jgi:radical SAM protein with 4Fe4S-binding SPASM domain
MPTTKQELEELYFSAYALNCYDSCKLKFRRRYIDGLFWPNEWVTNEEERLIFAAGQKFHTAAERYYTQGEMLDPKELLAEEPDVSGWLENLVDFRPYEEEGEFLPEQPLRLNDKLRLMAQYDLLYLSPTGQVVIYDWKTSPGRLKREHWENNFQTLVYRYLLAKAGGDYAPKGSWEPEDITLIYWNPRYPGQKLEFYYNRTKFKRDEERLSQVIAEIKKRDYDEFYAADSKVCRYCEYRPMCHGQEPEEKELAEEDLDLDLDWDSVEGIGGI